MKDDDISCTYKSCILTDTLKPNYYATGYVHDFTHLYVLTWASHHSSDIWGVSIP